MTSLAHPDNVHQNHISKQEQHSVNVLDSDLTVPTTAIESRAAVHRAITPYAPTRPADILALQRTIGNQAALRLRGQTSRYNPIINREMQSTYTSELPVQRQQVSPQKRNSQGELLDAVGAEAAGAGGVALAEALLRELYQKADQAIYKEAQFMISQGVPKDQVAQWVVKTRNEAKLKIRKWDMDVLRLLAERRNMDKYGDPVGPSYNEMRKGDPSRNKAPKTDQEIIENARKTNPKVDSWAGRFRIGGVILIGIDISISAYTISETPAVDRPRVAIQEAGGLAGAMAGGWAGAKKGGEWGGKKAGKKGALIGGIIGGITGAFGGAWGGRTLATYTADQLYPPAQTAFEGGFR